MFNDPVPTVPNAWQEANADIGFDLSCGKTTASGQLSGLGMQCPDETNAKTMGTALKAVYGN